MHGKTARQPAGVEFIDDLATRRASRLDIKSFLGIQLSLISKFEYCPISACRHSSGDSGRDQKRNRQGNIRSARDDSA